MEASNLMGGFFPCGDDDEWDINIFFCDNDNHQLDLGLQTGFVGDQNPPSSFSSSSSHDHNQAYFPANQALHQYNHNNGGGDDYSYFDQPQENIMNQQVMQIDDINDFFVPDFSENVLATKSINDPGFVQNHESHCHHDAVSVKKSCKRKFKSSPEMEGTVDDVDGIAAVKNSKKKPRVSKPANHHTLQKVKNKKNAAAEPRRRRKLQKDGDDEGKMISMPKIEEGSDDDTVSNGNKTAPSSSKAGAATIDSQSLYARKRREKINERLKILQNLVPNGTKVDISTMLEEAVIYVKFLQLQIKLLSSEDTWMYAPIAYNGMDIGRLNHILPL